MITHLPSYLLLIGYVVFWVELYFIPLAHGRTSFLAWGLWCILAVLMIYQRRNAMAHILSRLMKWFCRLSNIAKIVLLVMGAVLLLQFAIALFASLLPPHLMQESDALNYHLTLPRQHLILESFAHIPWSSFDLLLLPIDMALAPFSLATPLPNKLSFLFFAIGLVVLATRITFRMTNSIKASFFVLVAICASHWFGIQLGLAMFDLVMCYLLLAAFDSVLRGRFLLASVECAFYCWSKGFIPVFILAISLLIILVISIFKRLKKTTYGWGYNDYLDQQWLHAFRLHVPKFLVSFMCFSVLIGGPFMMKSWYYSGTPLFPVGVMRFGGSYYQDRDPILTQSIQIKAKAVQGIREQYGGRSFNELIEHFWLMAVPEQGVNNRYDYPLGLVYLLCLVPFCWYFVESIRRHHMAFLPWFIVGFWGAWWLGSHQTRFLFPVLALMGIVTFSNKRLLTKMLLTVLLIALLSTVRSMIGAHADDFGKSPIAVLRPQDWQQVLLSQTIARHEIIETDNAEAAFAGYQIDVTNTTPFYVFKHSNILP